MDSKQSGSRNRGRGSGRDYRRHGSRYKARSRAVEILFEAEIRDVDPVGVIEQRQELAKEKDPIVPPVNHYTKTLVEGVAVELDPIDAVMNEYLTDNWAIDRIPAIDRAILRVILWEIFFNPDVPGPVAVVEGTELASQYSGEQARAYINAMLDRIVREEDDIKARMKQWAEKAAQAEAEAKAAADAEAQARAEAKAQAEADAETLAPSTTADDGYGSDDDYGADSRGGFVPVGDFDDDLVDTSNDRYGDDVDTEDDRDDADDQANTEDAVDADASVDAAEKATDREEQTAVEDAAAEREGIVDASNEAADR